MKNTKQNTSRKINGVLDTYLQETEVRKNPYKKAARGAGKIEETWVGTKPQNSTTFLTIKEKCKIKLSRRKGRVTTGLDSHTTA